MEKQCSSVKYLQKGASNLSCNEKDSRITRLFKIDGNGNIDKNFDDSFDIKVVDDVISNLKCSNVNPLGIISPNVGRLNKIQAMISWDPYHTIVIFVMRMDML